MQGILSVYKPAGITSYDVIRQVKKLLPRGTKIGHAGTLDPFAEGVLLLLTGKATKRFDEIRGWQKSYRAVARLGAESDTLDVTGEIRKSEQEIRNINIEQVQEVANKFVGEYLQTIPIFSAAKVAGKPRYKYARLKEEVPQKSKKITVYSIKVLKVDNNEVELLVTCGSGTYIRQLSYDIFKTLGIESYLERLTREEIGVITTADCATIDQLTSADMVEQILLPAHGE